MSRATGEPIVCIRCRRGCCDKCELCCCEHPDHGARWFEGCPECGQGRREVSLRAMHDAP